MAEEKNNNFAMIAIVAIVAVVAVSGLFQGMGVKPSSEFIVVDANLAGEATLRQQKWECYQNSFQPGQTQSEFNAAYAACVDGLNIPTHAQLATDDGAGNVA